MSCFRDVATHPAVSRGCDSALADDLLGGTTAVPAAGAGSIAVVEAQVPAQLPAQPGLPGHQVAGKCRPPTLLQDRPPDPFDTAVGLRPPGMDELLAAAPSGRRPPELPGPELKSRCRS